MLPSILSWLALVSPLALAIVLVRKYLRTCDMGFVWLGVAGVIWPLVSGLLVSGLPYSRQSRYDYPPFL